jgi:hypothetical protein
MAGYCGTRLPGPRQNWEKNGSELKFGQMRLVELRYRLVLLPESARLGNEIARMEFVLDWFLSHVAIS